MKWKETSISETSKTFVVKLIYSALYLSNVVETGETKRNDSWKFLLMPQDIARINSKKG